jgi:hypothetical protein
VMSDEWRGSPIGTLEFPGRESLGLGGATKVKGAQLKLAATKSTARTLLRFHVRKYLGRSHARNFAIFAAGRRQRSCLMRSEGGEDVVADGAQGDTDGGAGQDVA